MSVSSVSFRRLAAAGETLVLHGLVQWGNVTQTLTFPIGTSDRLDLADGLPLFPVIGTSRAGFASTFRSQELLNRAFNVLNFRTTTIDYFDFYVGILGPALAFYFPDSVITLENIDSDTRGQVTVDLGDNQGMVAGMFIGCVLGLGIRVIQQVAVPSSWYQFWKVKWATIFDVSFKIELDLIKLLLILIKLYLEKGIFEGTLEKASLEKFEKYNKTANYAKVAESFKFFAYTTGTLGPDEKISATPRHQLQWDVLKSSLELRALVKALKELGAELQFGPCLELTMPVSFGLEGFTLEGGQGNGSTATYSGITYDGHKATATGATRITSKPKTFQTNVSYSTGFAPTLSVFFKIGVLKFFSAGGSYGSLDLLRLFGKTPSSYQTGDVITQTESGCIIVPQMTMGFVSEAFSNFTVPENTVVGGVPFTGTVYLEGGWQAPDVEVELRTDPLIDNFPHVILLQEGASSASFTFTFPNLALTSGDPADPSKEISPSTTSPDSPSW